MLIYCYATNGTKFHPCLFGSNEFRFPINQDFLFIVNDNFSGKYGIAVTGNSACFKCVVGHILNFNVIFYRICQD